MLGRVNKPPAFAGGLFTLENHALVTLNMHSQDRLSNHQIRQHHCDSLVIKHVHVVSERILYSADSVPGLSALNTGGIIDNQLELRDILSVRSILVNSVV